MTAAITLINFSSFSLAPKRGFDQAIADGLEVYLMGRSDKDMRQPALVRLGQHFEAMFKRDLLLWILWLYSAAT